MLILILMTSNLVKNDSFFFGSRQNFMGLTVALDDDGKAEGQIFWDDGQSIGELNFPGPLYYEDNPE